MSGKDWSIFDPVELRRNTKAKPNRPAELRRQLDAIWETERHEPNQDGRMPEALCRGYGYDQTPGYAVQKDQDVPLAPGDERVATKSWVTVVVCALPGMAGVKVPDELKGISRYLWRAAMGVMVARPRGQIERPSAYLTHCVGEALNRRIADPRGTAGYFASDTWPKELLEFALVALPPKYTEN